VLAQTDSFYVEPGSYSTRRENEPPAYVRQGGEDKALPSWLQLGADHRLRFEYRDDDIRRPQAAGTDMPLLLRSRVYAGVQTPWQPLRFAAEFQDSRRFNGDFPRDDRDFNEHDFIQGWAELHWPALLGHDPRGNARPLNLRAGRMSFEMLDRRLIARNEWRNTSNNFDGVRLELGQEANDWHLEFLALHPVTRLLDAPDSANKAIDLSGVVGHWRAWSPKLTLEPFYLRLRQAPERGNDFLRRDIKTLGLRWYGTGLGGFNYDVSLIQQTGWQGEQEHEADAVTAELGYTWNESPWKPRLSAFVGHASGDADPTDATDNRFERLFGFGRPWSANDYIVFENLDTLKWRLELAPPGALRIDAGYSLYWLAQSRDRFSNLMGGSGNRDLTGQSGDFLGREFDLRARYPLSPRLDATLGYAWFATGEFVKQRQTAALGSFASDSDFAYLELTWRWL
jgi:hypothetical protein